MAGKGFRLTWSPTTTSGSVSEQMTSWPQLAHGALILNHIFVKSNPTTVFDFKIISPTGNVVWERKGINGELNEMPDILLRGLYTLKIENAEIDASFTGEFMFWDKKDK